MRVPFSATVLPLISMLVAPWPGGCGSGSDTSDNGQGSGAEGTSDDGSGSDDGGTGNDGTGGDGSGASCGELPPGVYGDCVNHGNSACEASDATCLQNDRDHPDWGVCSGPCEDVCDCWAQHPEGTAEPACSAVLSGDKLCVLDCTDGKTCPDGMQCVVPNAAVSLCVFDADV